MKLEHSWHVAFYSETISYTYKMKCRWYTNETTLYDYKMKLIRFHSWGLWLLDHSDPHRVRPDQTRPDKTIFLLSPKTYFIIFFFFFRSKPDQTRLLCKGNFCHKKITFFLKVHQTRPYFFTKTFFSPIHFFTKKCFHQHI